MCGPGDTASASAVAPVFAALVGDVFEEFRHGGVSVLHPDHGGTHFLARLEVHINEQYVRLAGIDVLLIFGVGIKTQRPGFSVFYLGERTYLYVGITVHGSVKDFCKLLCCKFHRTGLESPSESNDRVHEFVF